MSEKHRHSSRLRDFFCAAAIVAGGVGAFYVVDPMAPLNPMNRPPLEPTAATRPLTSGEKELVRAIFGDSIKDLHEIRIHHESMSAAIAEVVSPRDIIFYGLRNHSEDYSRENNAFLFGAFVNEMTHIWQIQNGMEKTRGGKVFGMPGSNLVGYDYGVGAHSHFHNYFIEQQASIMEDYARYYYHPSQSMRRFDERYLGRAFHQQLPKFTAQVEEAFPAAREGRIEGRWREPRVGVRIEPRQPDSCIRIMPGVRMFCYY